MIVKRQRRKIMNDFAHYINIFDTYVESYLAMVDISSALRIKKEHTHNVVSLGEEIAKELPTDLHFPALLACLFHDIGRFEQMRIYKTFHDPKSCNHAMLGMKVLKQEAFLSLLDKEERKLVYTAIALHNRYIFPSKLPEKYKPISLLLRDADKIDIMRVMVENFVEAKPDKDTVFLHVKDEPELYTKEIVDALLNKKSIRYSDLRYVNDFRILLGGWLNDLNYKTSRKLVKENGNIEIILRDLPKGEDIERAKDYIYTLLES